MRTVPLSIHVASLVQQCMFELAPPALAPDATVSVAKNVESRLHSQSPFDYRAAALVLNLATLSPTAT